MLPPILASLSTFASRRATASRSCPPRLVVKVPPINLWLWLCHHHPPLPLSSMVDCSAIVSSTCSIILGASSTPWSPLSSSHQPLLIVALCHSRPTTHGCAATSRCPNNAPTIAPLSCCHQRRRPRVGRHRRRPSMDDVLPPVPHGCTTAAAPPTMLHPHSPAKAPSPTFHRRPATNASRVGNCQRASKGHLLLHLIIVSASSSLPPPPCRRLAVGRLCRHLKPPLPLNAHHFFHPPSLLIFSPLPCAAIITIAPSLDVAAIIRSSNQDDTDGTSSIVLPCPGT